MIFILLSISEQNILWQWDFKYLLFGVKNPVLLCIFTLQFVS